MEDGSISPYLKTHFEEMSKIEIPEDLILAETVLVETLTMGYALMKTSKYVRFTQEQEDFIQFLFRKGQEDKTKKVTPKQAVIAMRRELNEEGERKFIRELWLSEEQFVTAFGRISAQKRAKKENRTDEVAADEIEENLQDMEQQRDLIEMAEVAAALNENEDEMILTHPLTVSY